MLYGKGDTDGDWLAERDHFYSGLELDDWDEDWDEGDEGDEDCHGHDHEPLGNGALLEPIEVIRGDLTDLISKVTVNPGKKIVSVTYDDHDTMIVKAHEDDDFDPYVGTALGMVYKIFGSRTAFRKWVDENSKTVKAKKTKAGDAGDTGGGNTDASTPTDTTAAAAAKKKTGARTGKGKTPAASK